MSLCYLGMFHSLNWIDHGKSRKSRTTVERCAFRLSRFVPAKSTDPLTCGYLFCGNGRPVARRGNRRLTWNVADIVSADFVHSGMKPRIRYYTLQLCLMCSHPV